MENPIKWMIWGYPYFWKHPYRYMHFFLPPIAFVLEQYVSLVIQQPLTSWSLPDVVVFLLGGFKGASE